MASSIFKTFFNGKENLTESSARRLRHALDKRPDSGNGLADDFCSQIHATSCEPAHDLLRVGLKLKARPASCLLGKALISAAQREAGYSDALRLAAQHYQAKVTTLPHLLGALLTMRVGIQGFLSAIAQSRSAKTQLVELNLLLRQSAALAGAILGTAQTPSPQPSSRAAMDWEASDTIGSGMHVSDAILAQLIELKETLLAGEDNPAIRWMSQDHAIRVFMLGSEPVVFKMYRPDSLLARSHDGMDTISGCDYAKLRFARAKAAAKICEENKLDSLCVPNATLLATSSTSPLVVIAEEQMYFAVQDEAQEELYSRASPEMLDDLTTLIHKTGSQDIEWRNCPIATDGRVALIDLETVDAPLTGIYGNTDMQRRGLIGLLSNRDAMDRVARLYARLAHAPVRQDAIEARLQEVAKNKKIADFHKSKGLTPENARSPVVVDLHAFELEYAGALPPQIQTYPGRSVTRTDCLY